MPLIRKAAASAAAAFRGGGGGWGAPVGGHKIKGPGHAAFARAYKVYSDTLLAAARRMPAEKLAKNPGALPWKQAEREFLREWEKGVKAQARKSARDAMAALKLPSGDEKKLREVFDLDNPYSKQFIVHRGADLVKDVSETTRAAIRQVATRGFVGEKLTVDEIARRLRGYKTGTTKIPPIIGLTEVDARAVANHRAWLQRQLNSEDLVARVGYDQAWATYAKRTAEYIEMLRRRRAENIARTETAMAHGHGRETAWKLARDQGYVSAKAKKRWITGWDERTCPICSALHNVEVDLDAAFDGGIYHEPAHPSCRCSTALVTRVKGSTRTKAPEPSARNREKLDARTREQVRARRRAWDRKKYRRLAP